MNIYGKEKLYEKEGEHEYLLSLEYDKEDGLPTIYLVDPNGEPVAELAALLVGKLMMSKLDEQSIRAAKDAGLSITEKNEWETGLLALIFRCFIARKINKAVQ